MLRRSEAREPALAQFREGDSVFVNNRAPAEYRGRRGIITEVTIGETEFRVEFDDGRRPTTGYVKSEWLGL
jgi:hypothetical protein